MSDHRRIEQLLAKPGKAICEKSSGRGGATAASRGKTDFGAPRYLQRGTRFNPACYQAEQFAEKATKACLFACVSVTPRAPFVGNLLRKALSYQPDFGKLFFCAGGSTSSACQDSILMACRRAFFRKLAPRSMLPKPCPWRRIY